MGGENGGYVSVTEEYDGSSWSSGGSLATARAAPGGAGTQSAGLCMGGSAGVGSNATEEYNGTSWTAGGNIITKRDSLTGAGTQSVGLCFAGVNYHSNTDTAVTEEYNTGGGSYDELFTASQGL
tara:strand:+ start:320 stop:691 length:372 start_codon:yes stop_codon:yes gene_type:complete